MPMIWNEPWLICNLQLALPGFREAARIYRIINRTDNADKSLREVVKIDDYLRQIESARATTTAASRV
jgi:hypothetical protein